MRIEAQRAPLAHAVALAARVACEKKADHASGLLLLEGLVDEALAVSATNLDESVRILAAGASLHPPEHDFEVAGFAIDAKRFSALLAAETAEELTLTVKGKHLVVEGSCRAEFRLLPADALPALPRIGDDAGLVTFPRECLSLALQRASGFVGSPGSHSPTFFALEAEEVHLLTIYSSNGYALYREATACPVPEGWEVLAERRVLDYVKAAGGETVELGLSGGFVALRGEGVEAFFRRPETSFEPGKWGARLAAQKQGEGEVMPNPKELLAAVGVLAGMAEPGSLLTVDGTGAHLAAETFAVDRKLVTGVRSFATKEAGLLKRALAVLEGEVRAWETEKVLVVGDDNGRGVMLARWGG